MRLAGGEVPGSSGMRCTSFSPLSGGNYFGNSAGNTSLYADKRVLSTVYIPVSFMLLRIISAPTGNSDNTS